MKRTKINALLDAAAPLNEILLKGWVRTRRDAKSFSFLEINDGSCLKNIQVVADAALENYEEIRKVSIGSALSVSGRHLESQGGGQRWEIQADKIAILSLAPDDFPLQKKRHTDEYLRSIAHLRSRTNKYGAMFRIRSELAFAVHQFFRNRGFRYIHTPIITASDCEGAGELFRVTTQSPPLEGKTESPPAFFGKEAYLTVSGQLSAEMFALSLGDVYTFGPTFRAENSNTRRHASEFWMVEPEMAFCDLEGNIDIGESLIQETIQFVMESCSDDIELFSRFVDKGLPARLERIVSRRFARIPYAEAIDILKKSKETFSFPPCAGDDLQTEHEKYLSEVHFKKPVVVYDYPKTIKPFYMRLNPDGETVAAVDILVPSIGEIIGGSQREERLDILKMRMKDSGLPEDNYWWYLDSRRFGTVEHSGFGLGFERLLMLVTGTANIRDVIPFPRTPNQIDF